MPPRSPCPRAAREHCPAQGARPRGRGGWKAGHGKVPRLSGSCRCSPGRLRRGRRRGHPVSLAGDQGLGGDVDNILGEPMEVCFIWRCASSNRQKILRRMRHVSYRQAITRSSMGAKERDRALEVWALRSSLRSPPAGPEVSRTTRSSE